MVEDDRTTRKLLIRILEEAGYDVIDCGEGRDGIHLAQMSQPIAMLIDVMLPDMEGTKIVEELEYLPNCRYIKSIFLTSILKNKERGTKYRFEIEGKEYKALAKPVRKSHLLKLLKEAIDEAFEEQEEIKRQAEIEEQKAITEMEEFKRQEAIKKQEAKDQRGRGWYQTEESSVDAVFEDID